jgi:hypothetical protein
MCPDEIGGKTPDEGWGKEGLERASHATDPVRWHHVIRRTGQLGFGTRLMDYP